MSLDQVDSGWWRGCVIYQIYPRSFADISGDGVGDLGGITARLDYVASLGVDAVWISPFFKSPMRDFGYDVSDYRDVDPMFGSLSDFQALLARAHELELRVIIDQVMSHSSDLHPWFAESRSDRENPRSDWYVWADPLPDGSPPNNWLSVFGGPAWTWEPRRRQYYLHNFLSTQPDFNFYCEDVRRAHLDNLRFWLELGVDGVRLDVVNFYFHSAGLENNPARKPENDPIVGPPAANPYAMQMHQFDITQPENLGFLTEIRDVLDAYPGRTSVGEISSDNSLAVMGDYTSGDSRLHMAYTFDLLGERPSSDHLRQIIRVTESTIGDGWPCWALSNHDVERYVSRWGKEEDALPFARVALALLLTLRGSICLYQGDELGLEEGQVPRERIQDPYGLPFWPVYKGRDGCRTPMVWDDSPNAGFSENEPWLPVDSGQRLLSVASQMDDPDSTLQETRNLMKWRNKNPAVVAGSLELLEDSGEMLCWIRRSKSQAMLVAFNLTADTLTYGFAGKIAKIHEPHRFAGRVEDGAIILQGYEAVFIELSVEN